MLVFAALRLSLSFPCVCLRSLGTLAQGVSCKVLQESLLADSSRPAVRKILSLLRQQPGPLHTSLVKTHIISWPPAGAQYVRLPSSGQKTCVIDELYRFEFFSELLQDLGAEIALSIP